MNNYSNEPATPGNRLNREALRIFDRYTDVMFVPSSRVETHAAVRAEIDRITSLPRQDFANLLTALSVIIAADRRGVLHQLNEAVIKTVHTIEGMLQDAGVDPDASLSDIGIPVEGLTGAGMRPVSSRFAGE